MDRDIERRLGRARVAGEAEAAYCTLNSLGAAVAVRLPNGEEFKAPLIEELRQMAVRLARIGDDLSLIAHPATGDGSDAIYRLAHQGAERTDDAEQLAAIEASVS